MRLGSDLRLAVVLLLASCGVDREPGTVPISATMSPVELTITRDAWGVAHVRSPSDRGAFYGVGYVHAQDRLFQMDLWRRRGEGRLAAAFGREFGGVDLLRLDRAARVFGLIQRAEYVFKQLGGEMQDLLRAYADGVNDAVKAMPKLPDPFADYGLQFDTWLPHHAILIWDTIQFPFASVAGEIATERRLIELAAEIGRDAAIQQVIYPKVDDSGAVIPEPPQTAFYLPALMRRDPIATTVSPGWLASQAFAVSGARMAGGKPALFGHPQLGVGDRLFHEVAFSGATFDVHGIGFAGAPMLLIGYTPHTAWTVTSMWSDQADLFRLELVDDKSYSLDGVATAFEEREEPISIKGEHDETVLVQTSYFGPVVNPLMTEDQADGQTYAMARISQFDYPGIHTFNASLGMLRATSWQAFERALSAYVAPSAHVLFVDDSGVHGTLAYKPGTLLPERSSNAPFAGAIPQSGTRRSDYWQGFIQPPTLVDPSEGYIVVANNRPVGSWWPHYGLGGAGDTERSWYLRQTFAELLPADQNNVITVADLHKVRVSCVEPMSVALRELANAVERYEAIDPAISLSPLARQALTVLNAWSGEMRVDDPQYALPAQLRVDAGWYAQPGLAEAFGPRGVITLFKAFAHDPLDVLNNHAPEIVDWVNTALEQAWNPPHGVDLNQPENWQVDTTARFGYNTNYLFKQTLNASHDVIGNYTCAHGGTFWSQVGNTYSQMIDLSAADSQLTMSAPGVSQDPTSPYFANQMPLWDRGDLRPSPLGAPEGPQQLLIYEPREVH